jgi:hypothetical protein
MMGMFEGFGAIMKLVEDPNITTAAESIGKAAQELPADVREIRDLLKAMLGEMKHVDETLNRLIPKHHAMNWPHEEFKLETQDGENPDAG